MGQVSWEADKMLDVYIYDYLMKRNLQSSAKTFMAEGKVSADPVAIDAPGGFLFEWWSVFWDIFIARSNEKHSSAGAAYFETQQMKAKEQSNMQQSQMRQLHAASSQRGDANHPSLTTGAISVMNCDGFLRSSAPSSLSATTYGEHLKNPNSIDREALKSPDSHPGQSVQGHPGNTAVLHIPGRSQHTTDVSPGPGGSQKSLSMDSSSLYTQRHVQGKSGLGGGAGLNQGASGPAMLNGRPLLNEQVPGSQAHRTFMPSSNQYQVLTPQQQQQLLGHMQANTGNSHGYGEMDPQRLRALQQRGGLNLKDGQSTGNDGQVGSPMHPTSPMVTQDQINYFMKMQQSSAHKTQEQLQQHQLQQNNRKRKPTSSGAANSTGTGNTVGPSCSQQLTPSSNTPGDTAARASSMPHASSMPKSSMMYGVNGAGVLGSSSNQMDDLEDFGDFEDHVESFLSNDEDARDTFIPSKNSPAEHTAHVSKGFTEIGCNRTSNNKVLCCHFSSDGKLLASAGHEKKVLIWNMGNLKTASLHEEHTGIITDIRFRPDAPQLATSSFDRTVRLWNADEPSSSLHTFTGHSSQVTSVDFHPKKTDVLCSCDDNGEILLWDVKERKGSPFCKGASQQVRFQPRTGQYLAAVSENMVSIFDFETKRKILALQGHNKELQSVCWNPNGEYLASVSNDVVKVWSTASGECIHELRSDGINLNTCIFHPASPGILLVGGYQSLQLWDMLEQKTITIPLAHDGLITALATSVTGTIASTSHDKTIKLWK